MSLQWTFVATFLYAEIFLCLLLMFPYISAQRWQKVFRSRMLNTFRTYANLYFNVFIVVLIILFFDSVREMVKYHGQRQSLGAVAVESSRLAIGVKLFRSQRNFYICGFSVFLWTVLRKVVTMISNQASLEANCEAAQKQAESATAVAKKLMEEQENKNNEKEESETSAQEVEKIKQELAETKELLTRSRTDLDAMKRQAESTNTEYDRLLGEHAKLQEKVDSSEGRGTALKKED